MSQIKIEANPSGGGIYTLQSGAGSTDRTITLPDKAGEVAVGAGTIVQVVSTASETETVISSTTFTDIGLSASITPSSSTNKVLVLVSAVGRWTRSSSNAGGGSKILRDSTAIHTSQQSTGNGPLEERFQVTGSTSNLFWTRLNVHVLDSPASTSSLTYKVQAAVYDTSSGGDVIFQQNSTTTNSTSYITLMEVVA